MRHTIICLTASAAILASACPLQAQLVIGYKYQYNDAIAADTGRAAWSKFNPIATSGGNPETCSSSSSGVVGAADNVSYAPTPEQRKAEIYLWYEPSKGLSRAQIIRHEEPLPIRESSGPRELIVDPFTLLTNHTVLLVDFGDSTITAYNRRETSPQLGVVARLGEVMALPLVKETIGQIDEAKRLCRMQSEHGARAGSYQSRK